VRVFDQEVELEVAGELRITVDDHRGFVHLLCGCFFD